jgi:ribosome-associated protein
MEEKRKRFSRNVLFRINVLMDETKELIEKITEGIQGKKGKNIVIADLTGIGDTICKYFVICQGNSPSQIGAIVDSIKEHTRKGVNSKPIAIDGLRNAEWVAMDYADVLVHVFLPDVRAYYNLEHLWADAGLMTIPDID